MDVGTSKSPMEARNASSRDPRLASRPKRPPIVTRDSHVPHNRQPSMPHTPSEHRGHTPRDPFVQSVSELVEASVAAANYHAEKERFQRRRETTEGLLKRAKAHTTFPSIAAFYQQVKTDEDAEATRVDETIRAQSPTFRQLENNLKSIFGAISQRSSKLEEEMTKLRTEFNEKNDKLRTEFNEENDKLRTELCKRQSQVDNQQSQLDKQELQINKLQAELNIVRTVAQKAQVEGLNVKSDLAKSKVTDDEGNPQSRTRISILQDRVMMLERTVADHSKSVNTLSTQAKEIESRIERPNMLPANLTNQSMPPKQLEDRIERPNFRREKESSSPFTYQNPANNLTHPKQLEDRIQRPNFGREKEPSSPLSSLYAELDKKVASMDSGITELFTFRQSCSGQIQAINNAIAKHEEKVKLIDALGERLAQLEKMSTPLEKIKTFDSRLITLEQKGESDLTNHGNANANTVKDVGTELKLQVQGIELRLKELEQNHPKAHPDPAENRCNELDVKVGNLTQQLSELCEMQAMKDDLQFSTMEEVKTKLNQQTEQLAKEFAALKNDHGRASAEYSRLSEDVKKLASTNSVAAAGEFAEHSASIQRLGHVVETIRVGLHSLETRYNSLSTEPIVKNMVVAMQDMYPSTGALADQVAALRAHVDNVAPPELKADVAALKPEMASSKARIEQVANGLVKLASDHANVTNRLTQSQTALWDKVDKQTSWPAQEFKKLQANAAATGQKLDAHISAAEQQVKSKETADKTLIRSLNEERNRLDGQVQTLSKEMKSLTGELKALTGELGELKATKASSSEAAEKTMQSILDRLSRLDESTSSELQAIQKQFAEVFKQIEAQSQELSSISRRDGGGTGKEIPQSPLSAPNSPKREPSLSDSEPEADRNLLHLAREELRLAEANPALALRNNHKKKKRKRSSTVGPGPSGAMSEDERSTPGSSSTPSAPQRGHYSSPFSSIADEDAASRDGRERKKARKKKKRKHGPITID